MDNMLIGVFVLVVFIIVVLVKTAVVVEQQYEYVIERLGKYRTTLRPPDLDTFTWRRVKAVTY